MQQVSSAQHLSLLLELQLRRSAQRRLARRQRQARARWLRVVGGAAAVVEVADVSAVEDWLLQVPVDLVVHVASPGGRDAARADLGRELVEDLAEVAGALATG